MTYPLANDENGNPIDVPPDAVGWRVRCSGGRRGRPRNIYDTETGRQLQVELGVTLDDLIDRGVPTGRYRLEAVNAEGRVLPHVMAYTEVPEGEEEDEDETSGLPFPRSEGERLGRAMLALERQSETLRGVVSDVTQAFHCMVQAFAPMRPAPPAPIIVNEPVAAEGGGSNTQEIIVQTITQVANTLMEAWKQKQAAGGGA